MAIYAIHYLVGDSKKIQSFILSGTGFDEIKPRVADYFRFLRTTTVEPLHHVDTILRE